MAKKPTLTRALKIGDVTIPIVEPEHVQAVCPDLITEAREFNGVVAIGLATVVVTPNEDGTTSVEAIMCSRLRMSVSTAMNLRDTLTRTLDPEKKANDPL